MGLQAATALTLGVHPPEIRHEQEAERVASKVREFKLEHPVMLDKQGRLPRACK